MIRYRLDDLGWYQFEQLCQTLMKAHLGIAIEAWGGNADLGRDCYCERPVELVKGTLSEAPLVFQAKFVAEANAAGAKPDAALLRAIRSECERMKKRVQERQIDAIREYILLTNAPVTPTLELAIQGMITDTAPNARVTIQRGTDLCALIDLNPRLRVSYPQLLGVADLIELSEEAVRRAVNKTIVERSAISLELAHELSRVFVTTSIYEKAVRVLGNHNFVVLTGPPEMGKTTIARVLALAAFTIGFEYYECRSPQEFLQVIERNKNDEEKPSRQIFIADDAFGSTEYDPSLASAWARDLEHILHSLDSKHRLIWTSRSAPLALALERLHWEGGRDEFPKPAEVFVSADALTVEEKALILYRHAKAACLDSASKKLIRDNAERIVGDEHFTPERIRRFVKTTLPQLVQSSAGIFGKVGLQSRVAKEIRDPTKRMRTSFNVLSMEQRQLLVSMLDCESGAVKESELDATRARMFSGSKNTDTKLIARELDGHFILTNRTTSDITYSWIHPSWRDLIIEYLATHQIERREFLTNCTLPGIMLALSTAGGQYGERQTPFLSREEDVLALISTLKRVISGANYKTLETLTAAVCQAAPVEERQIEKSQKAMLTDLLRQALAIISANINSDADGVTESVLENTYRLAQLLGAKPSFTAEATWLYYVKELKGSLEKQYFDSVRSDFFDLVHLSKMLKKNDPAFLAQMNYPDGLIELFKEVLKVLDSEMYDTKRDIDNLDQGDASEKCSEFADWEAAIDMLSENAPSNLALEVTRASGRVKSLIDDLNTREEEAQNEEDEQDDDDEMSEVPVPIKPNPKPALPKEPKGPLNIALLFSDL